MAAIECAANDPLLARLAEDHWTMAILFQRLSEGLSDGLKHGVLVTILDALAKLAAEHLAREEDYLARHRADNFEQHRREHAEVMATLKAVLAAGKAGRPFTRADVTALSAMFTDQLFAGDRRDGLTSARN